MKKALLNIFSCVLILLCCGCSREQKGDIYIIYTNDVAGELNGAVGYGNVKACKDMYKTQGDPVLLVDAGDFYDGKLSDKDGGEAITALMNLVGYDYAVLGNQEFSVGLDALACNIREAKFTFLSCNMRYTGFSKDPLKEVKPYAIRKIGGIKIAFIGVTTPETLTKGKESYEALLEDGELIYDFYEGNGGQDLYDQVQKTVDKVRNKVDYVIVLAHLGSNSVREGLSSYELIANTEGIDVVIDGHSHTVITGESVENKNGEGVVLTSTGQEFAYFGVLTLHEDHTYTTVLYSSWEESDAAVDAFIDTLR